MNSLFLLNFNILTETLGLKIIFIVFLLILAEIRVKGYLIP